MPFSKEEKQKLLEVKFVGETVIRRFEQIGIDSLESYLVIQLKRSSYLI